MNGGYGLDFVRLVSIELTEYRAAGSSFPTISALDFALPRASGSVVRCTFTSRSPAASAARTTLGERSSFESLSASNLNGMPATSTSSHSSPLCSASHAMRSRTNGPRPRSSFFALNSFHFGASSAAFAGSSDRVAVIAHDSSGLNAAISRSRSTIKRVAGLWTRPALRPPATFFHRTGETRYPTTRSRIRRACCASTRFISIDLGRENASATSDFVTASKTTRFASVGEIPSISARCHAMASPSRSRSVANQIALADLASFFSSLTVFNFASSTT